MSEVVLLLLSLIAGVGLGLLYFGGLWWTVRKLPTASSPALLILASLAIRTGLAILGFYLVMAGRWERLLACLAGFLLVRTLLVNRLGPHVPPDSSNQGEPAA